MKGSSGHHFVALDQVRAIAAYLVFAWHFTHGANGAPIPFHYVPALFVFAPLDEGHTGVSLFMTLSGYLFAKLFAGQRIDYAAFLWNRFLRLAPLLIVVLAVVGVQRLWAGESLNDYLHLLWQGLWSPTLPNGGWSITVELHFYVLLPLLLWLFGRSRWLLWVILAAALAFRFWYFQTRGSVHQMAYLTIVGRIDQFLLGMWASRLRTSLAGRHLFAGSLLFAFLMGCWRFDSIGGIRQTSESVLWVVLPTLEGLAYALLIAWYDGSFAPQSTGLSSFVAKIGEYSYSIYLLHFFVVFDVVRVIHRHLMPLTNFYVACLWSVIAFLLMVPLGSLSFRWIESPFLKWRKPYIRPLEWEPIPASTSLVTELSKT